MEIRNTTPFHVIIAICFAAIVLLCWSGIWYPCLYLATLIIVLYLCLGAARNGKIDPLFLVYPILSFGVCWVVAFFLAQKYALLFKTTPPTFTIMGFNPSFFWIFALYWLGGVATLGVGFYLLRDRWLSTADWEHFKARLAAIDAENARQGGNGRA